MSQGTKSASGVPPPPILEVMSLLKRHPNLGVSLLHLYAPQAIVRLRSSAQGTSSRIAIHWLGRQSGVEEQRERILDWSILPPGWMSTPEDLVKAAPEHERTAAAAIAVMALLIHDLEGCEVREVLPIGSGGDYNVLVASSSKPIQVEVSGIEVDRDGKATSRRVNQKWDQVLTHQKQGFVSVTTFDYKGQGTHSRLLFVRSPRKKRPRVKKGKP